LRSIGRVWGWDTWFRVNYELVSNVPTIIAINGTPKIMSSRDRVEGVLGARRVAMRRAANGCGGEEGWRPGKGFGETRVLDDDV
jgi:hypothetical protein